MVHTVAVHGEQSRLSGGPCWHSLWVQLSQTPQSSQLPQVSPLSHELFGQPVPQSAGQPSSFWLQTPSPQRTPQREPPDCWAARSTHMSPQTWVQHVGSLAQAAAT